MSPNAAMASHASQPESCFLPRAAAKATSSAPAGNRRIAATKKGRGARGGRHRCRRRDSAGGLERVSGSGLRTREAGSL